MDINTYLTRIVYHGNVQPDLQTLKELQKQHLLHVPFENLDIHYHTPIRLNTDAIYRKVVERKRGGFCYELNGLFLELLTAIGFETRRISGRVYNGKTSAFGQEYDHLAVVVILDDREYLVDVGLGEFAFAPLMIDLNTVQQDVRGNYVIREYDTEYLIVYNLDGKNETPKYIFKNIHREYEEFSAMCNYHQSSPESPFTKNKLVSLPTENGRISLTDDKLKATENGHTSETTIADKAAFEAKLREIFGITVP
ncbi:arylamine N-acetyltransferase family protein [Sinomicrobium weinanense]|uniref:Arylamine N-acetyltransferase n=1 Tax=Sinomicrobium weinanense TaxID=2842200 RepID=A0A926JU40_9FLAO|nr:arylamine N-acetyltransferase [Sinomicrobium weinanense]MBC9797510.1 arylamine N-acetyltransferase [Sinomicrobium weinanense]MBU3122204.1 arylamine N-acetyltransferase [Sinomicrobium weinanense]